MADEFQLGNNNNWWDSSRNPRFGESAETPSLSATLNSTSSFSWPSETVDTKAARFCSAVQESSANAASSGGGALTHPNLHMMGLGLSSQGMNWNINQPVFRDEKADNSNFRSMLEEGMSSNTYFHHQQSVVPSTHLYTATTSNPDDSSTKQRGFSLDQPYNDTDDAVSATAFHVDAPATAYEDQSMFEGGLLASDSHQQQLQPSSYQRSYSDLNNSGDIMMPIHPNNVTNKFPEFIVRGNSPPKQHQTIIGQLQFSNSSPFWSATAAAMNDVRSSSFFPSLQTPLITPTFDQKQKNNASNSGVTVKKSSSETSNKRPRNESSSPLPAFKVRKEKMGDRINALQQLVSPFGKTDTASVLSEAIEYIKFLHEQLNVLSTPYMRSGASVQNQQRPDNKTKDTEAQKQDLRSRGLCLVPVSSTFPVTHESTVEFYTPTFGGTFR
ncbi:basic helix-loop-helix transcription factor [Lithospermum erythrorhizon]|uniref:Basic helix-loop-helix transcription factor n=1 Tax=Lithospermum erythrorhizon TaxID=34254 RepID=A0AAV3S3D9_LITER